jgi:hypothetical protein
MPTVPGDLSRLLYDFLQIQLITQPYTLAALRAESRKALLDKAINSRQNAWYAKYGQAPAIILQMNKFYSPLVTDSKPVRLEVLSSIAKDQFQALKTAYSDPSHPRMGVVRTTNSVLSSKTQTKDKSQEQSKGKSTQTGGTDEESLTAPVGLPATLSPLPQGGASIAGFGFGSQGSYYPSLSYEEGTSGDTTQSSGSETSHSSGTALQHETIVNTDYGYRTPYFECRAQFERAQISLIDQQFAQFMYGQNLPHLAQVFQNELNSMDGDIYRLQIAYLSTILMSPIPNGIVTGVYKNPGDPVRAGEPVIRVENNSTVYLMATLVCSGLISIGSTVTVNTSLYDSSTPPTPPIVGQVVAVRGHRGEDDQWDVIVSYDNTGSSGGPVLPLYYNFDYDDTTATIS